MRGRTATAVVLRGVLRSVLRNVLRSIFLSAVIVTCLPRPVLAKKKRPPASLRVPVRLTAGEADQFLGVLGPDDKNLYFISNRNATAQVFRQRLPNGTPTLLFSDAADVSWPRPSPDGKHLLYISTRDDATGDVCLRDVNGAQRRCLTDARSAENQAFWFPNGDVGVLSRRDLHSDLRLHRLRTWTTTASLGKATTSLSEKTARLGKNNAQLSNNPSLSNLGSPTVSPSGQWLVYVPLERRSQRVGVSFAMKLGDGLRLQRLDKRAGPTLKVRFNLPGSTGFPAFSRDGQYLYFAQHLSDTNRDGQIDGDDHSVLFRVRFRPAAPRPIDPRHVEQLTSARWNCQYPAPGTHRLVATCLQRGSLDIYSLPLDGAVPTGWRTAKLQQAFNAARDPWERLLLLDHLRRLAPSRQAKVTLLRQMSEQHLRLGELSSTRWYANRAAAQARGDALVRSWAAVMGVWVNHLRDERRLDRGELDDRFVASQRAHLRTLSRVTKGAPTAIRTLATVLRAEILDLIGREGKSLRLLRQLKVKPMKDRVALHTIAERAPERLLALQDKKSALRLLQTLAAHKHLSPMARLDVAERFTALVLRGLPTVAAREAAIRPWLERQKPHSELSFRLTLEMLLLPLRPENQESVRKAVFLLYRHSREMPRRRALVSATVRRAAAADNAYLLYQFSNSWASWVRRDQAERAHAVALFQQVVLERAYLRWTSGDIGRARASFYGVIIQNDSLEAWIGFYETRLLEGKTDVMTIAQRRFGKSVNHPVMRFLRAYAIAHTLTHNLRSPGEAEGNPGGDKIWTIEQRLTAITTAQNELKLAAEKSPQSPQIQHLRGYFSHQRLLATGEREAATRAHAHYLMALDLSRGNARMQASLLQALTYLQAAVGNHHIALAYLHRRARLPMVRPEQDLSLRLAKIRSLAHIGQRSDAAKLARQTVGFVDATPALARTLPLVLDRAALWSWAAGDHNHALALLRRLRSVSGGKRRTNGARADILEAGAALGAGKAADAVAALRRFDRDADRVSDNDLSAGLPPHRPQLRWRMDDLRAIADGLRGQALAMLRKPQQAALALSRRVATLRLRAEGGDVESWRLLAAGHYHLAGLHRRMRRDPMALKSLESGLEAARRYATETGTIAPDARLALLLAWVQLTARTSTPTQPQLVADLRSVYGFLSRYGHPSTQRLRALFAVHLTQLNLRRRPVPNGR